jgi:transcriptional regulator with XRE-family HTH domain
MVLPRETNAIDVHVGHRVRLRRLTLNLTQGQLGDRLGVTFQQVQKYERGVNRIGASRLFDLGSVLGVEVSFFYEGLAEPEPVGATALGLMTSERFQLNRLVARLPAAQRLAIIRLLRTLDSEPAP